MTLNIFPFWPFYMFVLLTLLGHSLGQSCQYSGFMVGDQRPEWHDLLEVSWLAPSDMGSASGLECCGHGVFGDH